MGQRSNVWAVDYLIPFLIGLPVVCGVMATVLPAFGYFPALGGHTFTLEYFRTLFDEPGILQSIALSFWVGLSATFLSLMIACLVIAVTYGTKSWRIMLTCVPPLLSIPHVALAFGVAFMIAPSGFIVRLISPYLTGWTSPPDVRIVNDRYGLSLIFGLVLKEVPFLLFMMSASLGQIKVKDALHTAYSLGYGRMVAFIYTVWPLLYRQIRMALFAVLMFSASVIDVSLILGPNTPAPFSVLLIRFMSDPDLNYRFVASSGAVVQCLLVVVLCGFWMGIERVGDWLFCRLCVSGRRFSNDTVLMAVIKSAVWLCVGFIFVSMILLALWSFAQLWQFTHILPQGYTLDNWARAVPQLWTPFLNSVIIGLFSGSLAVVICLVSLICGMKNKLTTVCLTLPLIIPQAGFLFGIQGLAAYVYSDYGYLILVFTHLIFVLPYVFLSLAPPWHNLDPRFESVAQSCGVPPLKTVLLVRLPLMLRPILTSFAIGFAVSNALYLPTILIGAGRISTIAVEAVALSSGGSRRVISVYAFILCVLPLIGFALAYLVPSWVFRKKYGVYF
jgi:putative thiamine transport system permease protein